VTVGPIDLTPDFPVPWRPPRLRALVRRSDFQETNAAAATWLEDRFRLLERRLPWLERVDSTVSDYCFVGAATYARPHHRSGPLRVPRDPRPPVTCWRDLTVAYGFSGAAPDGLAELIGALEADGWSGWKHRFRPVMAGRDWLATAQPSGSVRAARPARPGLEPPPLLTATDPALRRRWTPVPVLALVWTPSGGREAELESMRRRRRRPRTWPLRPENFISQPDPRLTSGFPNTVLAGHANAVLLEIGVEYYQNEDARTGTGRLPRQWLPVMW
jgi:hypothetical protein